MPLALSRPAEPELEPKPDVEADTALLAPVLELIAAEAVGEAES